MREINDIHELAPLRPMWRALLEETPQADFFHTLDWLEVYWRHYGAGQKLRVLVDQDGGEVRGILPLVVFPERTRLGTLKVLTYPLSAWGSYYGPIGPESGRTLTKALEHVHRSPRDYDYLELRWVPEDASGQDVIAGAMRAAGLPSTRRLENQIVMIDLSVGWDAYFKSRTGSHRSNCRRYDKRVSQAGEVEYVHYRPLGELANDANPRWELYEACEDVARRSWQGASPTGTTLSHTTVRGFLRDVHLVAAREGALDLHLLNVNGRPVAFEYNYVYRGRVSSLRRGFDEAWGAQGVGTALTYHMLRACADRGDHTFDYLPGSIDAKRLWMTRVETSSRYSFYPVSSPRAQLLRAKRWLASRVAFSGQRSTINGQPPSAGSEAATGEVVGGK